MGIDSLTGRIILLPNARFDYTPAQVRKFIRMWNEGEPISRIAERFMIAMYEVSLLVMHCELEGWIEPRPGGLRGTKKHKWRQKEKMRIEIPMPKV